MQTIINDLKSLYSTDKKGYEVVKGTLLLFDQLENEISQLPKLTKENKLGNQTNYAEIEGVILNVIVSDKTPVDVLVIRRAICRCLAALYTNNPILAAKTSSKLINFVQNVTSASKVICIMHCLGTMYAQFNAMPTLLSLAPVFTKFWRMSEEAVRASLLVVVQKYIHFHDRIAQDWTDPMKYLTLGASDGSRKVRMNVAKCLFVLAVKTNPEEAGGKMVAQSLQICLKGLEDSDRKVRSLYATAAGQFSYAVVKSDVEEDQKLNSGPKQNSSSLFKKKEKVYTYTTSLFSLTSMFAKSGSATNVREAVSMSTIHFLCQFKEKEIESNLDLTINHLVGILSNPKLFIHTVDVLQAQYFIGRIIRFGLTDNASENGKLAILSVLCGIVSIHYNNEYALVCILKEIGYLCKQLGEVVQAKRDIVLEAILLCLKHRLDYVRYVASVCIRSLSESIPTQTTTLVNAMLGLVQMDHAELAIPNSENEYISKYAMSLHGHATALGALISTTLEQDLSLQYHLCTASLDTACLLLNTSSNITTSTLHPYVMMRRQEACWVIISSVMSLNEDWVKLHLEKIFDCWDRAMGPKTGLVNTGVSFSLRTYASALLSIYTFIQKCPGLLTIENMTLISKYITNIVKLIETLSTDFQPKSSEEVYSINILKMNLFKVYKIFPRNALNKHTLNFVTKLAVAEADGTLSKMKSSLLDTKLNPSDDVIDDTQDLPERCDYNIFESAKVEPFEVDASIVLMDTSNFYEHQVLPISVRVVDEAILMLAAIFGLHKNNSRNQIIDNFVLQIKAILKNPDDSVGNLRVFTNVVASSFMILDSIVSLKTELEDKSFLTNIHAILLPCLGHGSSRVRRCAAEAMGLLSMLLGEVLLEDLIKRSTEKINSNSFVRIGYSLALGHVNKSLVMSQALLPSTVSILQAYCRSNTIEVQASSLHSVWYCTESCGIGFSPYIESITQLLSMLIFSLKSHDTHLLLAAARNLHAQIGVYGPEISNKKYLVGLFDFFLHDFLSSTKVTVKIEAVALVQRAAMLAPSLIKIPEIIPYLNRYIETSNQKLKSYTAECVLIIAKTQPKLICQSFPPGKLFRLLDVSVHATKQYFKDILELEVHSGIISPKKWIESIFEIIKKTEGETFYSYHTKVYALDCLIMLVKVLSKDSNHTDLKLAAKLPEGDALVLCLQDIIKIANIAVNMGSNSLKYEGLVLFTEILKVFGNTPDPIVKTEMLLSQEAAHFISALGQGFEKSNPPLMFVISCKLSAMFIPSKMLVGQGKTLSRVCGHLISYLPIDKDGKFQQYGDIATTLLRLSILSAFAEIFNAATDTNNVDLLKLLDPLQKQLVLHWIVALRDYTKLVIPNLTLKDASYYQDGTQKQVVKFYRDTYGVIIESLSRLVSFEEVDPMLLFGLSMRNLSVSEDILVNLNVITRLLGTDKFKSNSNINPILFEILLTLIKVQTRRDIELQNACLNILNIIMSMIDLNKLGSITISQYIHASIQVCTKSLKLHIPAILDNEGATQQITPVQSELLQKVLETLVLIAKIRPSEVNTSIFGNLLLIGVRSLDYSKQSYVMDYLKSLLEIIVDPAVWSLPIQVCVFDVLRRIDNGTLSTSSEIDFMFLCIFSLEKCFEKKIGPIHQAVITSFKKVFATTNTNLEYTSLVLQGLQDGIIRLARSGESKLAVHYLGQINAHIISLLIFISKQDLMNESNQKSIININLSGINILLASFSLIDDSGKSAYLSVFLPCLVIILKYSNSKKLTSMTTLCVQCLQRLGSTASREFKEQVQKMPVSVVSEMQMILTSATK